MPKEIIPVTGEQEKKLTSKQRRTMLLQDAHGKSVLLTIGVSDYNKSSGFAPLRTCSNDALAVKEAFLDVWQLNADPSKMFSLTSKGDEKPSRGVIIQYVKKVSDLCEPNDRLILYFSGHGQRLKSSSEKDKFYLVPQDVYDESDPEAMVSYDKVLDVVESSDAKQKIIIIDACMSGPHIEGRKFLPATYSRKFLSDYMETTKGIVILASSSESQSSFVQSPNPELSLFTHFLILGLKGDNRALDGALLTTNSLYAFLSAEVKRTAKSYQKLQTPTISCKTSGVPVLADFSRSIISPDSFDLDEYPITGLLFRDLEQFRVKNILTKIKSWHYSQRYLESKVNEHLGEYLEEDFGKKVVSLRKAIGVSSNIGVEVNTVIFPAGKYSVEYIAEDQRAGKLRITLALESEWFARQEAISKIITAFDMRPSEMTVKLSKIINPNSAVPGLEAKGWEITSCLPRKIEAEQDNNSVIIEADSITFQGLLPRELFGSNVNKDKAMVATSVLALIAGK